MTTAAAAATAATTTTTDNSAVTPTIDHHRRRRRRVSNNPLGGLSSFVVRRGVFAECVIFLLGLARRARRKKRAKSYAAVNVHAR